MRLSGTRSPDITDEPLRAQAPGVRVSVVGTRTPGLWDCGGHRRSSPCFHRPLPARPDLTEVGLDRDRRCASAAHGQRGAGRSDRPAEHSVCTAAGPRNQGDPKLPEGSASKFFED